MNESCHARCTSQGFVLVVNSGDLQADFFTWAYPFMDFVWYVFAVCCNVLQCSVAVCCSAVCCSVFQSRVAVCSSVLQSLIVGIPFHRLGLVCVLQCVAVCCSVLQSRVAVCVAVF